MAATFLARLRGLLGAPPLAAGQGLWIAPCCAVHTFGMSCPIDVVFVDDDGWVVAVHPRLPPRRLRACWSARATLELAAGFAERCGIRRGVRLRRNADEDPVDLVLVAETENNRQRQRFGARWRSAADARWRRRSVGSSTIEWLIAAPLVLLLGLGTLQWGMLFHARQALDYAVAQAARSGAVGAAGVAPIERGLAQGLLPYFGGASNGQPVSLGLPQALVRIRAGQLAGWLQWRQLSPTRASFDDWGEPARDAFGDPVAGAIDIPNDNLRHRPRLVGATSGQTLADANLLKLELTYGVPLSVPLVGELAVWWMEVLDRCRSPAARMLGAVPLPATASGLDSATTLPGPAMVSDPGVARPWRCTFYRARDEQGRARARWPVRVYAMMRMHTPSRLWAHTPGGGGTAAGLETTTAGGATPGVRTGGMAETGLAGSTVPSDISSVSPLLEPWVWEPLPTAAKLNVNGSDSTQDGSGARSAHFLQLGSDRELSTPGSCVPTAG